MKSLLALFSLSLLATFSLAAQEAAKKAPAVFADYFTPGVAVKGEVVVVIPPDEIQTYVDKVEKAAKADPEWFAEYSKSAAPGIPLPFHEKLGLTKAEYEDYLKLWDAREFKPLPQGELILRLEEKSDGKWMIRVTGRGTELTAIAYDAEEDVFRSMSGEMKRIEDINADKRSILGAWTGKEWKLEQEDAFGVTKENIAVGKLADGSYGLLVYRLQEVSSTGTRIFDKSLIIRFAIKRS
ncbi:MAG: hypothetical protein Q7Q71_11555 [Verrucomicrobiota bacterium JB023]|nr:hypothetical protein [Verrucomicrobiota bacterium JB023]